MVIYLNINASTLYTVVFMLKTSFCIKKKKVILSVDGELAT